MKVLTGIIIILVGIACLVTGIIGYVSFSREVYLKGNSYLVLAQYSNDIYGATNYLKLYRDEIIKNKMDKGSIGVYYKTPNNDMANRMAVLSNGIAFLENISGKFDEEQRLNTADVNSLLGGMTLTDYVTRLDVKITHYMTANNLWYRFLNQWLWWSIFIMVIFCIIGGIIINEEIS